MKKKLKKDWYILVMAVLVIAELVIAVLTKSASPLVNACIILLFAIFGQLYLAIYYLKSIADDLHFRKDVL